MKRQPWIVVTTINSPTTAMHRFAALVTQGWRVAVAGDLKTPADWSLPGVDFLDVGVQRARYGSLADRIPTRHYARKNLAYLFAIENGASLILDTDDDNIPLDNFGPALAPDVCGRALRGPGWVNVYRHFTGNANVWPRGLPLTAIGVDGSMSAETQVHTCPVQQFLADADPDVDAIYRLVINAPVNFDRQAGPIILDAGTWGPFNSQNTVFFPEAFPLLYLPGYVSFRMTDIWRSFVAQAALARHGRRLSFHAPTVRQERNVHDLMRDFADEIPGYLQNDAIMRALAAGAESLKAGGMAETALALWALLRKRDVVTDAEMDTARAWQAALLRVSRST